ncbi:LacI family transcriptional regulator [Anaerocolumna cellulosilytica]|uniref:LacI family transcriptional regulator n=1 Tax=Anaerocolumna cellulosilytica TaxID=433286 RepID=A0A6S6R4S1_9FIRM|nr:LacI family DNA-binding transcriptional regulator [Anaerocolumna cellulosilytica]MBB5193716.1 LacI family transcriptional regulator [Anaerocolumna cellulosilytica]BCJ95067.1 LacI family transcriptional regulator [Anaerocolumna cellulosilytica]
MRKVTMQDIADALNVSRVSVWKVFNDYPGVSEPLRRQIIAKAQEMGYLKLGQSLMTGEQTENTESDNQITISVVVSRPDSSIFWMNIIHCIAKELTQNNINLMYTYLPSKYSSSYTLPSAFTNGTVQGIIMLNVYDTTLLQMLNSLRIPKVFLDIVTSIPEDSLTGDLVLLEGRNSIRKITNHIIQKGRKNIGFIGATDYARTNNDRYEGFKAAMTEHNLPLNPKQCLTGNIGIYTYTEEINQFLSGLDKMPEAFVCVSDFVANFVIQYLSEHNINVPEEVAISGYDGSTEYGDLANYLTSVQVDTKALGKRLVKQLLYKMNDPDSPNEIIYLSFDIVYGESTNF